GRRPPAAGAPRHAEDRVQALRGDGGRARGAGREESGDRRRQGEQVRPPRSGSRGGPLSDRAGTATGQRARHRVRERRDPAALDLRRGPGARRGGDVVTGVEALRGLERPPKVFVAATGAGAGIQASLWSVPGSSAFLAGATFPYAAHETERLLGFRPEKFCNEDAAVELAIAAYLRAREATFAETPGAPARSRAIGLGLTASVASL